MTWKSAAASVPFLFLLGACSDAFESTPTVQLDHAQLDPGTWLDTMHLLDTATVSLRLLDASGDEIEGPAVRYESSVPEVLLVAPTGSGALVAALAEGAADIIAYVGDERFRADTVRHTVTVTAPRVSWHLELNLTDVDTVRVELGDRYAGGRLSWRSSNEGVLVVRSIDTAAVPLDTVAEVQSLTTGQASIVVSEGAAELASREISLPVRVIQKWRSVDAGYDHTCALTVGGTAYCWGGNGDGQLGDGSLAPRSRPAKVATALKFDQIGAGGVVSTVAPSGSHSCGRLGPKVFCWGSNGSNQLGDDSGPCAEVYVPDVCANPLPIEADAGAVQVGWRNTMTVGGRMTCAMVGGDPSGASCWGAESAYDAGQRISGGGSGTLLGVAGGEHVCFTAFIDAFAGFHGTRCSGLNDAGQLGDGTTVDRLPGYGGDVLNPSGSPIDWTDGAVGGAKHTCVLDKNLGLRGVLCWGWNSDGQLGPNGPDAGTAPCPAGACSRTPVAVPVPADVADEGLTLGWAHSCFLSTEGAAYCWGRNTEGQLGDGTTTSRSVPARAAPGLVFTSLSAGDRHTCGVDVSGSLFCWGYNASGQLGDGTGIDGSIPVQVLEPLGG